jgi:hypothetical protein
MWGEGQTFYSDDGSRHGPRLSPKVVVSNANANANAAIHPTRPRKFFHRLRVMDDVAVVQYVHTENRVHYMPAANITRIYPSTPPCTVHTQCSVSDDSYSSSRRDFHHATITTTACSSFLLSLSYAYTYSSVHFLSRLSS